MTKELTHEELSELLDWLMFEARHADITEDREMLDKTIDLIIHHKNQLEATQEKLAKVETVVEKCNDYVNIFTEIEDAESWYPELKDMVEALENLDD